MRALRRLARTTLLATAFCATLFGVVSLTAPNAEARPILLCGPTLLWVCSGPGGPDILFAGTVCEKRAFERQTGTTCVPYGG